MLCFLQLRQALTWITSGAPLFRTRKPATPLQHLVVYFALVDPTQNKLLLVDHKRAGLWLPSGGHVEVDEHPRTAVVREAREELGLDAHFLMHEPGTQPASCFADAIKTMEVAEIILAQALLKR